MRKIWKIQLRAQDNQVVAMPIGSQILTVQIQKGNICLWFSVDPEENQLVERHIRIIGTGKPIIDEPVLQYIGTVQMAEGDLIWHIFEKPYGQKQAK